MAAKSFQIRSAAVVGSGTMGSGIAALLAGVGIPVTLLDITPRELSEKEAARGLKLEKPLVRNRVVRENLARLQKARPPAFYSSADVELISPGNLEDDFDKLAAADWVIEVIVENLEVKRGFFERLDAIRPQGQIVSSNTSGLSISKLAAGRSADFRRHFLGTHFFNPPRYLKLLELIPTADTDAALVDFLREFAPQRLGKGVVLCTDTPNFIANRVGGANNGFRMSYGLENGYTVEEVDAIAGPLMGYPKTAVFRLMDLVGLDVAALVSANIAAVLPGDAAAGRADGKTGVVMESMLEREWLGNKTGIGFYKRVEAAGGGKEFWPLDVEKMEHVPPTKVRFDSIGAVRKIEDLGERLRAWVQYEDRAARYVWHTLAALFDYAAQRLPEIADETISIDDAMRWGYMMAAGPFEYWDMLGVAATAERMEKDGYTVARWVADMLVAGHSSFYREMNGAKEQYDPGLGAYVPVVAPQTALRVSSLRQAGRELEGNAEASMFDMGDGVLLLEFHGKANTLGVGVVELAQAALQRLEGSAEMVGMVIGNQGRMFSAGANIDPQALLAGGETPAVAVERMGRAFQDLLQGMRYCPKPVVAAPFDRTLGGGTEVVLAAARIVAHIELYMGLVEVGVGLVPAGGGCKEMLRRVMNPAMAIPNTDPIPVMQRIFETIGMAKVSVGAIEAREMGYLQPADRVVMDRERLLGEAKREVLHMAHSGHVPPRPEKIYAGGRDMLAALRSALYQMREGEYVSDHDRLIGEKLGWILTGGDISAPEWVDEQYILDLERAAFVELIQTGKTMERVLHTLKTGKPLRN